MIQPPLRPLATVAAVGIITIVLGACSGPSTRQPVATNPATTAPASSSTTSIPTPAKSTIAPATANILVGQRTTPLGTILTSGTGLTLYTFTLDRVGHSACTGGCATAWPPLILSPGNTLTSRIPLPYPLATIARAGGARQATYDGHPLYVFAGDKAPGQTHGEGVKGVWFVATIDGQSMQAHHVGTVPGPTRTYTQPLPTQSVAPPPSSVQTPVQSPIPQGGGGDHDADNSGGPNDGDGNT